MLQDDLGNEHHDHLPRAAILWRAFKDRLGQSFPTCSMLDLKSLVQRVDLQDLDAPFTKKETDDVVMQLPSDKAPTPDGFNGAFIKACWNIIC